MQPSSWPDAPAPTRTPLTVPQPALRLAPWLVVLSVHFPVVGVRVRPQALLSAVGRQIVARGEIPFLHVFTSNVSAIALYRRQGMEIRRRLHITVLQNQG